MTTDEIPVILDVDSLVSWCERRGESLTIDEVETAGCRVGRNQFPALVIGLHLSGLLPADVLAHGVVSAWQDAEYPTGVMDAGEWRWLFADAGYTENGVKAARLTEPVMLYRGAVPEHARGWSWTEDGDLARWFADRFDGTGARVYRTQALPQWLLAHITPNWRYGRQGESEYVVDPTESLVVEEVP